MAIESVHTQSYTDCSLKGRSRSPGGVITSQTTLCRNFGGKEGGGGVCTFEGDVLAGHYGIR